MRMISFNQIVDWMIEEYKDQGSIFGIRREKFYKNHSGSFIEMFGDKLSSPIGPAAGPNSQLTQNIVASYLAGSRFIELKTVQKMDGEELRKCVAKPCINAQDECYNVEWSTELTVPEAFDEYIKAWFLLHIFSKELGISEERDFAFNMSVGYDLEGIKLPKIDDFIEGMKDASNTKIWKECKEYLLSNLSKFKNITSEFVEGISSNVCSSITLSTLHGCPPQEIERIARYLLEEKSLHTFIKCNPTLLGYEFARNILNEMGYAYISFDDHHFNNDLQYKDAVPMFNRLIELSKSLNLGFGVKLTNTFPVRIENNELPGEEMYMSGRSLFPLTISLANRISKEFNGELPISYSGGADFFNIAEIVSCGIRPITIATTILKPGGYERIKQLADRLEPILDGAFRGINIENLDKLATSVTKNEHHLKDSRTAISRKTNSKLGLYDCFKAPCHDGGCPIYQQIPTYLKLVQEKKYDEAFKVIVNDNATPAITGTICNHTCQDKCTRLDYDSSLEIRNMKRLAVINAQDDYIDNISPVEIITDKKVAVIGAGPGGVATAFYLRRNGVDVTVFEKREEAFGIVKYVIPEFRISSEMIERDFNLAKSSGVNFKFGVSEDYSIEDLKKEYEYIVLATGAWMEGAPPVKEGKENIIDALKFLEESKVKDCNLDLGRTVAVIGGGDVAMDCARSAKRAPLTQEVTIVYRRTKEFMPAEKEEIHEAILDGVKILELLAPVSYDGKKLTCEVMKLSEKDESGRRGIVPTGEIKILEFDTVIGAVGARVDSTLFFKNGLKLDGRGNVILNAQNEASESCVFVAGDCKGKPSTIVKALADGKVIASTILARLGLNSDFKDFKSDALVEELYTKKGVLSSPSKDESEGERCLSCNTLCELCCDVCPNRANIRIKVGNAGFAQKHQIIHIDGMCNECGNCGVFCPHDGNPYKDKVTLFWSEDDFIDSKNKGFLRISKDSFKVREEDGCVILHTLGDGKILENMENMINTVVNDYPYYFVEL